MTAVVPSTVLHRNLIRQLSRLGLDRQVPPDPEQWARLLHDLNRAHHDGDRERHQLETSIADSSAAMGGLNAQLIIERDQFARMFSAAPVGIVRFEPDGTMSAVNAGLARIVGYDVADLMGRVAIDLIHPEDRSKQERALKALFTGRLNEAFGEARLMHKDGSEVFTKWGAAIMRDDGGEARHVIAVVEDLTDRNKLEVELRHAQKLESVGRLAAGIAHEINTPIQFVGDNITFLEGAVTDLLALIAVCRRLCDKARSAPLVAEDLAVLAEAEETADLEYLRENVSRSIASTQDGVKRVATIVQSMKSFAHPDRGQKTTANLNTAVQCTLTVASNELKYVADVETDFGELPLVPCFLSDLNQVILNLLVNAAHAVGDVVKTTGTKGIIRVTTALDGPVVVLSVSDTGAGIPEAIRDRIFDPFFTTKDVGKGTGQGLALARSVVVEKHGGTIDFRSEPGKGTTFFVRLPLLQEAVVEGQDLRAAQLAGDAA
jgi:PAS domain S-box-containing protein